MKTALIVMTTALAAACLVLLGLLVFQQRYHESREISRVFRELGHHRTTLYLDEIDVLDCPADFRQAYAVYVHDERNAGASMKAKTLALARLEHVAKKHGIIFAHDKEPVTR